MADAEWYSYLESRVYTKVKNNVSYDCKFTTEQKNVSEANFPCVYIHELEGLERIPSLDGQSVNAVLLNIQIDIYATSKKVCREIERLTTAQMKAMRFNMVGMPVIIMDSTDVYHCIARFRRNMGADDRL